METRQDAKICAELFRTTATTFTVSVLLPNFGDESHRRNVARLSGLNVPVLIQAEEDNLDKIGLSTLAAIALRQNFLQQPAPVRYPVYADHPARLHLAARCLSRISGASRRYVAGEQYARRARWRDWRPSSGL